MEIKMTLKFSPTDSNWTLCMKNEDGHTNWPIYTYKQKGKPSFASVARDIDKMEAACQAFFSLFIQDRIYPRLELDLTEKEGK